METNESKEGVGVNLIMDNQLPAFISKALGPRWQGLSVYEKELLATVCAVQKWEQYLLGSHFLIKIDQKSLKRLLQQRISTPLHHLWLSKLMEIDYVIRYKGRKENLVAHAFSRVQEADILCLAITVSHFDLEKTIKNS